MAASVPACVLACILACIPAFVPPKPNIAPPSRVDA
jgi:hypothetical protein